MLEILMLAIKPQPRRERQRDMQVGVGLATPRAEGARTWTKRMNDSTTANRAATAHGADTRRATLAVAALIGVSFIGTTLLTPLYVLYRQVFGFSEITLTLLYAVYVIGNLAAIGIALFAVVALMTGRRGIESSICIHR